MATDALTVRVFLVPAVLMKFCTLEAMDRLGSGDGRSSVDDSFTKSSLGLPMPLLLTILRFGDAL